MLEVVLDARIVIGTALVVLVTLGTVLGGFYGFIFFLVALQGEGLWAISYAIMAALALLGVCGARLRLLIPSKGMSGSRRTVVRTLLGAGIISSAWAGAQVAVNYAPLFSALFFALSIGGILFVLATPKVL